MRAFYPRREHPALYGLSADRIAELCRVHVTTARRWKRGEEPPHAALKWIEVVSTGNLGTLNPYWDGWRLCDDMLMSPDQQLFTRGDILSLPFVRQQVAHYQRDLRLPRQADWIEGRYVLAREA